MALLVVMVLMGVMLSAGIAIASTVDTQTRSSRTERVRDSAFNLAEAALNAQVFAVGSSWPGASTAAYATCVPTTGGSNCPDNASLLQGASADLAAATWQTSVRDNNATGSPDFYSDTAPGPQYGYDFNGDGRVWVRAQATAEGRTRTLVGLVRAQTQEEDLPHAALLAGSLDISNNGNKELLHSGGGLVAVRCNPIGSYVNRSCVGHEVSDQGQLDSLLNGRLATQISGTTPLYNYPGTSALSAPALARLKKRAVSSGTYYTGCPSASQLTGDVVYVESGDCSYVGNSQFNTAQSPGVLVLASGTIYFGGTTNYYGVVYGANLSGLSTDIVQTQGNAIVTGGVVVEGNGNAVLGSSGANIVYDVNAYRAVASYGSAGVIQNTFREIKAG